MFLVLKTEKRHEKFFFWDITKYDFKTSILGLFGVKRMSL